MMCPYWERMLDVMTVGMIGFVSGSMGSAESGIGQWSDSVQ